MTPERSKKLIRVEEAGQSDTREGVKGRQPSYRVKVRQAVKNLSEVFKPEKLRPPQESEGIS